MSQPETCDRARDEPHVFAPTGLGPVPNEPYYRQPARRGGARVAGAVLLIVGLVWLATQFGDWLWPFGVGGGTLLDSTYTARSLVVDVGMGDVEVQRWSKPTMRVEAFYRGGSASDYVVSVEPRGDTLTVTNGARPSLPLFGSRNLRYRISVPAGAAAQIKTANGDVQASQLDNGVKIETVNGDIELDRIMGALDIYSTNGDLQLDNGNVENASVETVNGNIDLNGVAGNLQIKTTNGDISIADARDATLALSAINSDIRFDGALAIGANNTITNVSGDVEVRLPDDSSFDLRADTASGDILTEFELANKQQDRRSLSGTANIGGTPLQISTTSGDISVDGR